MFVFDFLNGIGLLAFAASGVFKGINKKLDLLGITTLGFLTALGGGIIRDIIVNKTPTAFTSYKDISITIIGIILSLFFYMKFKKDLSTKKVIKYFDAVGLAAFSVTGFIIGMENDINSFGIVLLGLITGTGGGLISDIFTGEVPFILKEDFYASCSIIGGIVFVFLEKLQVSFEITSLVTLCLVFIVRILAIEKGWSLPRVGGKF
ncbi:trimeric intracellular cation channel family protein [Desulfurobacterium thermolithotrophum]|uniref:trimeric intracellular cation channel family protein n=1 Tax=Desulfurobacterium thermolithotrophum TaxID=64160 RepID=UPI0013D86575|nr:TRIC cation channel family protein [Desulfurobacterium thermolithotrophum]